MTHLVTTGWATTRSWVNCDDRDHRFSIPSRPDPQSPGRSRGRHRGGVAGGDRPVECPQPTRQRTAHGSFRVRLPSRRGGLPQFPTAAGRSRVAGGHADAMSGRGRAEFAAPALPPAAAGFVAGWLPGGAGWSRCSTRLRHCARDVPRASAAHVAAAVAAAAHAAEGPGVAKPPPVAVRCWPRLHARTGRRCRPHPRRGRGRTGCPVTLARVSRPGWPLAHRVLGRGTLRPELRPAPAVVTTRRTATGVVGNWVVRREP